MREYKYCVLYSTMLYAIVYKSRMKATLTNTSIQMTRYSTCRPNNIIRHNETIISSVLAALCSREISGVSECFCMAGRPKNRTLACRRQYITGYNHAKISVCLPEVRNAWHKTPWFPVGLHELRRPFYKPMPFATLWWTRKQIRKSMTPSEYMKAIVSSYTTQEIHNCQPLNDRRPVVCKPRFYSLVYQS